MRGEPFSSGSGGSGGGGGAVASYNGRTGVVLPTLADVTGTGVVASDIGAVSDALGGKEKLAVSSSVSGTYTPNLSTGNHFVLTLVGNTTLAMPTISAGRLYGFTVRVVTNGFTLAYDAKVTFVSGQTPASLGTNELFSFFSEGDDAAWFGLHNTGAVAVGANFIDLAATIEPANPASGSIRLWFDTTLGKLIFKDSAGVKHDLSSVSAPAAGSIAQVVGQRTTGHSNTAAGTFSLVLPSTPTSGNMVVVAFGTDATGSITAPAGWTVDKTYAGTQNVGQVMVCRLTSTGVVGDKTALFTWSGTHLAYGVIAEYMGQHATPVDQVPAGVEVANTSDHATVTTGVLAQTNELVICASLTANTYGGGGSAGWGTSGFATVFDSGSGVIGSKTVTATTAVTATPTFPGNNYISAIAVTYKAA